MLALFVYINSIEEYILDRTDLNGGNMTIHEAVASNIISVGNLTIDLTLSEARTVEGKIHLSPAQFRLLAYLAGSQSRSIPHTELHQVLEKIKCRKPEASLPVHICNLKKQLQFANARGFTINNIFKYGYRMDVEN